MSDNSSDTKVNSELPDEDALGAFAANAFGPSRRGRRNKARIDGSDSAGTTGDGSAPPPAVAPEPGIDAGATSEAGQPHPEPQAAAGPLPEAPSPEVQPAPAPAPAVAIPAPSLAEPAVTDRKQIEVHTPPAPPPTHVPTRMPERVETGQVQIPNLGTEGSRATQCTIMVSGSVRDRIAQYQLSKKMETGKEPTNSVVVRRAFLNAKRNNLFQTLLAAVHHRQNPVEEEDYDDDGLLGEVVGRRVERGRMKDSQQQSFRPSYQELATYDAFSTAYGFPSRSDFLDACLDEFLPSKTSSARRGR